MPEQYVVELKHVTKKFPGVVAMRDMHIQIKPGEIHGLVGENGAGKSTLSKCIIGENRMSRGELFLSGEKIKIARKKGLLGGVISV